MEQLANGAIGPRVGANIQLVDDTAPGIQSNFQKHWIQTVFTRKLKGTDVVHDDVALSFQVELEFGDQRTVLGLPEIDESLDGVVTDEAVVLQLYEQIGVGAHAER